MEYSPKTLVSSAKKRIITSKKVILKKPSKQIKTHGLIRLILKLRELYKKTLVCFFNSKNLNKNNLIRL